MSQKIGAIIHVERGFQIAEVLDLNDGHHSDFVGYRVLGPGTEKLPVFPTEGEAKFALIQLVRLQNSRDPA